MRNAAASSHNYFALKSVTDCAQINDDTPEGRALREEVGRAISSATQTEWETLGVHLGYRYENSPIIVPDGTTAPEDHWRFYTPTARPGHRAPHGWLDDGQTSTLDLYGSGFVLLRMGDGGDVLLPDTSDWSAVASEYGMPLKIVDVVDPNIASLYETRFVLVRPDGQSAWRGDSSPSDVRSILNIVRGASKLQV
jgi:hypothetical protein